MFELVRNKMCYRTLGTVCLCSLMIASVCSGQVVQPALPTVIDLSQVALLNQSAKSSEQEPAASEESQATNETGTASLLSLADVIASLYQSYPEIQQARSLAALTRGSYVEAYGQFDTKANAYTLSEPTGFYENYRHGIGLARQSWWGGYLSAGYRIGRGDFAPWYLERETNKGGEFKVGARQPLLRGRVIDANRLAVFNASLDRQAAAPQLLQAVLDSAKEASLVYWEWVSAGAVLTAQRELLELAEERGEQFEVGVKAGKFAEIDNILNQQQLAERNVKVIESRQKFISAGLKLSLYLRDPNGNPLVAPDAWLPKAFPAIEPLSQTSIVEDIALAMATRPETRILQFEIRKLSNERALACNQLLPQLDMIAEASQDTGEPTSSKRDKSEFELVVGMQAEMPIQRRKARGKLQALQAKITQVEQKLRLQRNKIEVEVRTLRNAVDLAEQSVQQAELSLRSALDAVVRYRFAFERGKVDLIFLNLLEAKANETEIKLVEAQRNWFINVAFLQRALGLDPIESSSKISALPASDRIGPGNLPEPDVEKLLPID